MRAAYVSHFDAQNPLAALEVGDMPQPEQRDHWTTVAVHAASLNHHDLWSLRGVGLRQQQLPMILGTDAAGVTPDGQEVVVHSVIGGNHGQAVPAGEARSLLSEKYPGTLAEYVSVPTANLLPKPAALSWAEAACMPTAYLTAYRMLFGVAGLTPGKRVLIQGAGGGVSTAAIALAAAAGIEVFATSRSAVKRERAAALGASHVTSPEARLPARVDAVLESVGAATWSQSVKAVKPGGVIAVCGATTGDQPGAELTRIFFHEITVRGVTMGSRDDLAALLNFCATSGVRPVIDSEVRLQDVAKGMAILASGHHFGKIVVSV